MQKKASVLAGPNSYRHVTATELAQGFSRKTLSTALLGLMFASTAVAASAERSEEGKNSGRDTLVVNRSNSVGSRMIRWYAETASNILISVAKGGNYVWENAPSQADVIPYAAGMGAGAASFVVQRMFVQRAAAAAMERPWSVAATAAGGMLVQYAATNTETGAELVNAVTNTLPEIPEATKEGYATGSSAAGAVALAVDMYDFVGAIKQRYETPATDPAMEASVDKQYKKAKSKLERAEGALKTSEGDIVLAEQHMQNVRHLRATNKNRKAAQRSLKQAQGELPIAQQRLTDAQNEFDTIQANQRHLAQNKIDRQTSVRNGLKAGAGVALSDIRGISQTEGGTEALKSAGFSASSFVQYVVMDAPFDAWGVIRGEGDHVEIDNQEPDVTRVPQNVRNKTPIEVSSNGTDISASHVTSATDSQLGVFDPNTSQTFGDPKTDELQIDEQKVKEPQIEQSKVEQSRAEQSKAEQSKAEQSRIDESNIDDSLIEQSSIDESPIDESPIDESKIDDQDLDDQELDGQELGDQELDDPEVDDEGLDAQHDEGQKQADAPPAGKTAVRPAAGSYNSNAWAANTMFQMNLSDRLGSYYHEEDSAHPGSAWIRYSGSSIRLNDRSGELATKGDKNAVMMGVDMLVHSSNSRNQFSAGVMGGYGHYAGRTRSDSFNASSTGKVDGYGIGLYGTYQQDSNTRQGIYTDSWLLWNQFDNTVKDGERPTEKYDAKGVTASLEVGYHMQLAERNNVQYVLQPHAQVIYQNVRADSLREADGTRVDFLNGSRAQTVVGVRAAAQIPTGLTSVITPYLDASWRHSTKGYRVRLDDVGANMDSGRNVGQLKLGVQGEVTRAVLLNVELFHNQGNEGYRETGGNVMATYRY